eukprot:scaffold103397_cov66-Phaeocystis_antarctica.AAC.6
MRTCLRKLPTGSAAVRSSASVNASPPRSPETICSPRLASSPRLGSSTGDGAAGESARGSLGSLGAREVRLFFPLNDFTPPSSRAHASSMAWSRCARCTFMPQPAASALRTACAFSTSVCSRVSFLSSSRCPLSSRRYSMASAWPKRWRSTYRGERREVGGWRLENGGQRLEARGQRLEAGG